jgi:hypothetical protein
MPEEKSVIPASLRPERGVSLLSDGIGQRRVLALFSLQQLVVISSGETGHGELVRPSVGR